VWEQVEALEDHPDALAQPWQIATHHTIAKNEYLAETLDRYHNLSLRIIHFAMKRYPALTPNLDQVVHDQRTLLDAICRGDGDVAESTAREHVLKFERAIRSLI
jgi:DNA-binding GntR family transcriptional regulator